jgi:hypothetical protein
LGTTEAVTKCNLPFKGFAAERSLALGWILKTHKPDILVPAEALAFTPVSPTQNATIFAAVVRLQEWMD